MITKFLTTEKGRKVAAVIPNKEYEDLLQNAFSAAIIEKRRNDATIPWEKVKQNLIRDGVLPG